MLQITSHNNYSTPLKNSVKFGKKPTDTESYKDEKTSEQQKAEKLEKLAMAIQKSDNPSAAKSFTIVAALMSASALTAAALSRRFFNVLNGVGAIKKVSTGTTKLIEKLGNKVTRIEIANETGIKAKLQTYTQKAIKGLEDLSTNGIENRLKELSSDRSKKLAEIKRAIKAANPDKTFKRNELNSAVKEELAKNEKFRNELRDIDNLIKDAKGSNLLKKATTATAATVAGTGALTEASKDADNNGIPDCIENKRANKEATQKFTAALIDCALDSL